MGVTEVTEQRPMNNGYLNYSVLQKYAHIELKQNLLRSITLNIFTRLLDNEAFVCIHLVGRFQRISRKQVGREVDGFSSG